MWGKKRDFAAAIDQEEPRWPAPIECAECGHLVQRQHATPVRVVRIIMDGFGLPFAETIKFYGGGCAPRYTLRIEGGSAGPIFFRREEVAAKEGGPSWRAVQVDARGREIEK
jgi:hypothetical protein